MVEQLEMGFIQICNLSTTSLAQMLALGQYDVVQADITAENFQIQGVKESVVPHLYYATGKSQGVVQELADAGLRTATFVELLLFAVHHPEEHRKGMIVAIDDRQVHMLRGNRVVPILHTQNGHGGKWLSLERWDCFWDTDYRMAVVPV